jgi:hypothetical protein
MDDSVIWAEHGNRTYIRDRRRFMRPAFILGLILVAGCAIAGRFAPPGTVPNPGGPGELPDWLSFVYLMAAFMGLGLIISPGIELLELRKMEKKVRRGRDLSGVPVPERSKPWPESQEPPCRFTEPG